MKWSKHSHIIYMHPGLGEEEFDPLYCGYFFDGDGHGIPRGYRQGPVLNGNGSGDANTHMDPGMWNSTYGRVGPIGDGSGRGGNGPTGYDERLYGQADPAWLSSDPVTFV